MTRFGAQLLLQHVAKLCITSNFLKKPYHSQKTYCKVANPLSMLCIGKHSIPLCFCKSKQCVQSWSWNSLNPKMRPTSWMLHVKLFYIFHNFRWLCDKVITKSYCIWKLSTQIFFQRYLHGNHRINLLCPRDIQGLKLLEHEIDMM